MATVYFQNPSNGYEEKVGREGLCCLFFGCFYFLVKGLWAHAILSLVLAIVTFGFSWVVYPFYARGIVERSYLRKGWVPVQD